MSSFPHSIVPLHCSAPSVDKAGRQILRNLAVPESCFSVRHWQRFNSNSLFSLLLVNPGSSFPVIGLSASVMIVLCIQVSHHIPRCAHSVFNPHLGSKSTSVRMSRHVVLRQDTRRSSRLLITHDLQSFPESRQFVSCYEMPLDLVLCQDTHPDTTS